MPYARTIYAHEVKVLKEKEPELAQGERVLTSVGAESQAEAIRDIRRAIRAIVDPKGYDFLEQLPKE